MSRARRTAKGYGRSASLWCNVLATYHIALVSFNSDKWVNSTILLVTVQRLSFNGINMVVCTTYSVCCLMTTFVKISRSEVTTAAQVSSADDSRASMTWRRWRAGEHENLRLEIAEVLRAALQAIRIREWFAAGRRCMLGGCRRPKWRGHFPRGLGHARFVSAGNPARYSAWRWMKSRSTSSQAAIRACCAPRHRPRQRRRAPRHGRPLCPEPSRVPGRQCVAQDPRTRPPLAEPGRRHSSSHRRPFRRQCGDRPERLWQPAHRPTRPPRPRAAGEEARLSEREALVVVQLGLLVKHSPRTVARSVPPAIA